MVNVKTCEERIMSIELDQPLHGAHQVLKSVWKLSSQCWPGSVTEGVFSSSRGWLRRFLLLKLVTVLLFPHGDELPLLVSCVFSLRALLLLRSPQISTKPSTVFLGQLARTDALVLLHWVIRLGLTVRWWVDEAEMSPMRQTLSILSQQVLEAHHLASLLLLGLLGLEAMLVSRWPLQTRRFRTSQWAQFCCSLLWALVLLEIVSSLHSKLFQHIKQQTYHSTLPVLSLCMRRMLCPLLTTPPLSPFSPPVTPPSSRRGAIVSFPVAARALCAHVRSRTLSRAQQYWAEDQRAEQPCILTDSDSVCVSEGP
ncbi:uncharacterized protein LOC124860782 [Girardinichthys multiradiatus]|uniref:uncharacterized protein LOC124860782 n=1 Tax=Girardinichthys multiradiatus TaxID=208333 RepID=UPI001FAD4096|nr:uncharacterized protein LOC124860782 [Girardinichthys multiradiatus]